MHLIKKLNDLILKKTKEMHGKGIYLFKSIACSNTVYFEQLVDTQTFLQLAQQHLKAYMYIHEFLLTKDGWIFLTRLKSDKKIQKAYANKRKKYKKQPKELETWKIVSEQIRLFIGAYVTKYNQRTGREGSLIKRTYERYYFDSKKEAIRVIRRIRRRAIGMQQPKKMYRAKKGHYRIPKKHGKGGIFLSDRRKNGRKKKSSCLLDLTVFQQLTNKVLTKKIKKLVKSTKHAHNSPIPDI